VTAEALEEFLDKLTSAALGDSKPAEAPTRRSARRQRELAEVDRALDRAGIVPGSTRPAQARPSKRTAAR
jgi:hypothetical protein